MYKNNLLNLNLFFIFLKFFFPFNFFSLFFSFYFSSLFSFLCIFPQIYGTKHIIKEHHYHSPSPPHPLLSPFPLPLQAPQMHPPETAIATPSPIHYCHGTINHEKFFFNIFLFPQYSLEPSIG